MKKTNGKTSCVYGYCYGVDIVKMSILTIAIYGFNTIKIPMEFFTEIRKKNPKICMEQQKSLNSKAVLRDKNKAIGITPPGFKLYYKATVIKTVW